MQQIHAKKKVDYLLLRAPDPIQTPEMDPGCQFKFYQLQNLKIASLSHRDTVESLKKWSMLDGLRIQGYSFDTPYRQYLQQQFVQDFLRDPNVCSSFEVTKAVDPDTLKVREINCAGTSMALFDQLLSDRAVIYEGAAAEIKKCPETYFEEILVADELQKLVIWTRGDKLEPDEEEEEEDDNKNEEYAKEGSEFLFKLFGHLVLGGSLCQNEETVRPYLDVAKMLYKDLISVSARTELGQGDEFQLVVDNVVLQVEGGGDGLFRKPHYNNFMYLVVNQKKSTCYTLYHKVL